MYPLTDLWNLTILDGKPPFVNELAGCTVGDIDGDGKLELIVGGDGAILWYRADGSDQGVIAKADCGVALEAKDIDGDGKAEVIAGLIGRDGAKHTIVWYKPQNGDIHGTWDDHVIDPDCTGGVHDLIFADVDGDGVEEMLANTSYTSRPGIFAYRRPEDIAQTWEKHTLHMGWWTEGLVTGDFAGDGVIRIAGGPDLYSPPAEGPFSGPWTRDSVAPAFRELCRNAAIDITGNGRPDLIIVESEYHAGALCWYENRMAEDAENPWVEHVIDRNLNYAHTLQAVRDPRTGEIRLLVAEMMHGGDLNHLARVLEYRTKDGSTWERTLLHEGAGTHEAQFVDIDGDGELEVASKEWGKILHQAEVHIFKKPDKPSPLTRFRHTMIDRTKPGSATDILAVDLDGDGRQDIACGRHWYHAPDWQRREIPGILQVLCSYDLDGDGRQELIATVPYPGNPNEGGTFSNRLVWLKAVDPLAGKWEQHLIGDGIGDWPHGSLVAPVLPGGRPALIAAYHSAHAHAKADPPHYPEIFEMPDDPAASPWPKRTLAEIAYGEEVVAADINGDGILDIVAGAWWLENKGDGTFVPHQFNEGYYPARVAVFDVNGNGRLDIVMAEEVLYSEDGSPFTPFSPLMWFENPGDAVDGLWPMRVIDKVRCGHSVSAADLDGDGELEIICAEHTPYASGPRSRCRLMVYKKAEPNGRAWTRYVLDNRFEHHDGAKPIELAPSKIGIMSHGWINYNYLHLWEPAD